MTVVDDVERLAVVRAELRQELGLLHDRVNALLAAEAFLTIAYTAAMSNAAPWGAGFSAVVSPTLSVLGLVLALSAWPGVASTSALVAAWTADQVELLDRSDVSSSGPPIVPTSQPASSQITKNQRRSMLFFRVVPGLFALVWVVLTVVAVVLTW